MAGLENKFTVTRNDGQTDDQEVYFVLTPWDDVASFYALATYGLFVEETNPELSEDIKAWCKTILHERPEFESVRNG